MLLYTIPIMAMALLLCAVAFHFVELPEAGGADAVGRDNFSSQSRLPAVCPGGHSRPPAMVAPGENGGGAPVQRIRAMESASEALKRSQPHAKSSTVHLRFTRKGKNVNLKSDKYFLT